MNPGAIMLQAWYVYLDKSTYENKWGFVVAPSARLNRIEIRCLDNSTEYINKLMIVRRLTEQEEILANTQQFILDCR